jgi:2-C-methyl-D-erythritol 2,4-cyclodiphosphate synthase
MRIGIGYDSHRFLKGRRLIIGGVDIPYEFGLQAHSDGDVLCHAIIDAMLGGLGEGDIGKFFPDSDAKWKDAISTELLKITVDLAYKKGFFVSWIDSIIIAEQPKLSPYIDQMRYALSKTGIQKEFISIKAKTNEKMGFIGRGEGIVCQAICILLPISG